MSPKVHYRFQKDAPFDPNLSHVKPAHTLTTCIFQNLF
jgi:hypothetical protein